MKTNLLRSLTCAVLVWAGSLFAVQGIALDVETTAVVASDRSAQAMDASVVVQFEDFEGAEWVVDEPISIISGVTNGFLDFGAFPAGSTVLAHVRMDETTGNKYLELTSQYAGFGFQNRPDGEGVEGMKFDVYMEAATQLNYIIGNETAASGNGPSINIMTNMAGLGLSNNTWLEYNVFNVELPNAFIGLQRRYQSNNVVKLDNIYYYALPIDALGEDGLDVTITFENSADGPAVDMPDAVKTIMWAMDENAVIDLSEQDYVLTDPAGEKEFLGWSYNDGGSILCDTVFKPMMDQTLYAVWQIPTAPTVIFEDFQEETVGAITANTQFDAFASYNWVQSVNTTSAEIKEDLSGNRYLEISVPQYGGISFNQPSNGTAYMNARFDAKGISSADPEVGIAGLYFIGKNESWQNKLATVTTTSGNQYGAMSINPNAWSALEVSAVEPVRGVSFYSSAAAGTLLIDNVYYYELPEGKDESDYTVAFRYQNSTDAPTAEMPEEVRAPFMSDYELPVLPNVGDMEFAGWSETDGGALVGEKAVAYKDRTFYAVWKEAGAPEVTAVHGIQIRKDAVVAGMRFASHVGEAVKAKTEQAGFIVALTDALGENTLAFDTANAPAVTEAGKTVSGTTAEGVRYLAAANFIKDGADIFYADAATGNAIFGLDHADGTYYTVVLNGFDGSYTKGEVTYANRYAVNFTVRPYIFVEGAYFYGDAVVSNMADAAEAYLNSADEAIKAFAQTVVDTANDVVSA